MTGQNNNTALYHNAMRYGTLLGAIWSIMYILMFIGVGNTLLSICFIILFIGSPFIAAALANRYKKKECNGCLKYMQAWVFTYCMYICASILSAVVMLIYLKYIDNGMFFSSIQEILEEFIKIPGLDTATIQQLEAASTIITNTTTNDFVWEQLSNNILSASLLPFIIAIFVRSNKKE
jgi:hypothetical protein